MDPEPTQPGGPDAVADAPEPGSAAQPSAPRLVPILVGYTLARLALLVVLYLALTLAVVPLVALAFAVVLQLPLAWLLFGPLRRRVNLALAVSRARSREERAELRRALAGDES